MSPKKITDSDKQEIINLYCQADETTASLANRYGVSTSTISRLLKSNIPEDEYEALIQQKRGQKSGSDEDGGESDSINPPTIVNPIGSVEEEIHYGTTESAPAMRRRRSSAADKVASEIEVTASSAVDLGEVIPDLNTDLNIKAPTIPSDRDAQVHTRRVRRRSSALADLRDEDENDRQDALPPPATSETTDFSNHEPVTNPAIPSQTDNYLLTPIASFSHPVREGSEEVDELEDEDEAEDVSALAAMFGEEIDDLVDEEEEDDEDDESPTDAPDLKENNRLLNHDRLQIQVIPLSEAVLPRTCYIVIDKFAELIARPLKDFADLGQIPGEEIQQRTLPVFDNHRVAKRFSNNRTQRVIKVPDSRVFHKTTHHLRSKGITRLLVDGQIYSLN
jgi:hypothetical protein